MAAGETEDRGRVLVFFPPHTDTDTDTDTHTQTQTHTHNYTVARAHTHRLCRNWPRRSGKIGP